MSKVNDQVANAVKTVVDLFTPHNPTFAQQRCADLEFTERCAEVLYLRALNRAIKVKRIPLSRGLPCKKPAIREAANDSVF